ncbi:MAG: hypothetical protein IT207_02765 [Fimbriimonadaceae bacterium]|nr:hypothetical protein [Fimbriimonadaceae bacterium]
MSRLGFGLLCALLAAQGSAVGWRGRPVPWIGTRVMAVGDSITSGEGSPGGFRRPLQDRLRYYGVNLDFVGPSRENSAGMRDREHAGFGGWRTRDVIYGRPGVRSAGRLSDWLRAYQPSVLLVTLGTNDPWGLSYDQTVRQYDDLVGIAFRVRPSIMIVLSSVPGSRRDANKAAVEDKIQRAVAEVTSRWRARGYPVEMADPFARWDSSRYLADRYHPNALGYRVMADEFLRAMQRLRR